MSVGGAATFRGQAGLAKNYIKHGSRAHQCKHGIVLLHSHAGRRDGFAHSSSVAVGLRSRPLKHTVALSSPYLSLFVFWIWDVPVGQKEKSSELDGPASKGAGEIWSGWNQRAQRIVGENYFLWHSWWKETVGPNDVQGTQTTLMIITFEQTEVPAKLLDHFAWSNKSNINQQNKCR